MPEIYEKQAKTIYWSSKIKQKPIVKKKTFPLHDVG